MNVFNRVETKYLISIEQYDNLIELINSEGFHVDKYGRSTIQSLYYDTSNSYLIRKSLDKPVFKEKIRLRNYGNKENQKVYLELKRKFKDVVYKRRIETNTDIVKKFFEKKYNYNSQIGKEMNSFRDKFNDLRPNTMIISEREAYYNSESELRFTFDFNIRYRIENLNFNYEHYKNKLLNDNQVLLEIKSIGSYPLWLARYLNDNKIFKTSFSKYGNAYMKELMG